jgi:hypothetical protein
VDERHQRIQSLLVSLAPGSEQNRHLVGRAQNSCILTGFASCPFRLSLSASRDERRYVEGDHGPDCDGGRLSERP